MPEVERLPEVIDAVDEAALLGRGRRVRIVAALYHRLRARVHGRLVSVVSSVVSRVRGRLVSSAVREVVRLEEDRRVASAVSTGVVSVVGTGVINVVSKVGCASRKTGALSPILESCVMRAVSCSGDEVGS